MTSFAVSKYIAYASIYLASAAFVTACGGSSSDGEEPSAGTPQPTVAPPNPGPSMTPQPTQSTQPTTPPQPTATPEPSNPPPMNPQDPFHVSTYTPGDDADLRSLLTTVEISFNKPLVPATAVKENVALRTGGQNVEFAFNYDTNTTITLSPDSRLAPDTVYTVELRDSLMSEDGESLRTVSWNFTTAGNLGDTPQSVIDTCMSAVDRDMLDAVNNVRAVGYDCASRPFGPTYPYKWNCKVADAAEIHSNDMAANNFFSHTGSDGSNTGQRLLRADYRWNGWGENIAGGQRDVPAAMQAWLTSETGHCKAIMGTSNTDFGSSLIITDPSATRFVRYWTQVFARPGN